MTHARTDEAITTCPICGSTDASEVFSRFRPREVGATGRPTESLYGRAGRLVRCAGCTLVRQDPQVAAPYEDAEDPDYLPEEEGIRATFHRAIERIERYRSPPGRLLDIGCGPGLLLDESAKRGWDPVGVELSGWAVEAARDRGLEVHQATLDDVELAAGSVDAATLADVIEHVPQPLDLMRRLHELMAPGGVVFLATPDVDSAVARLLRRWWWSVLPGHIYLFSRATLTRLVRDAGFEVLEATTHPKTFSVDYYAGRFVGYSQALAKLARGALGAAGVDRRLVTPDFRDRVAVFARKPA